MLQKAFLDAYNLIRVNDKDVLESFLAKLDDTLMEDNIVKKIEKTQKEITHLESKNKELANYNQTKDNQNEIKNEIRACRNLLEGNGNLQEFDRFIFESIVEKVIVGGYNINGDIDPYLITFVLKIGKNVKSKSKTRNSNNGNGDGDSYQSPSSDPLNSYNLPSVNAC